MKERVSRQINRLEAFMATVDDACPLPPEAGRFAHALVLASGAKHGLEIGTSYGYSALWIASALAENGGKLITIDREPKKAAAAAKNVEAAGLGGHVQFREGSALDVLGGLPGPFDFVLNDADKEHCTEYVELLAEKLTRGAVILTDNITTHAAQLAEFMHWIREHEDFVSVGVPIGNGMELSVRSARLSRSSGVFGL